MPDAVAHLLIASILSAPAALVIAFLMVPPQGERPAGSMELESEATGSMDALTRGTLEGAQLLLNIVAMLVVFVALVALVNLIIAPYTLQGVLGWAARAARLAGGHSVERGARRRRAARHQDGDQRAGGLPGSCRR